MNDLSAALEEIRRLELTVAQQLTVAREEADAALAEATTQARAGVEQAQTRGRRAARSHYESTVADATSEAERVIRHGRRRAGGVADEAAPYLEDAAVAMIELLLAPPLEEGK